LKHFFKYLLQKPPIYLQVWAYIYANTNDEGVFRTPYAFVLSRFKITRSTLQRIVEFGAGWAENGQKVGREWADKELTIIFPTQVVGRKVGRKWAESGTKKVVETQVEPNADYQPSTETREKASSDKLYPKMIKVYNDFCVKRIGVGAKMDGLQGKCMKSIIAYLASQVKIKRGEEMSEPEMNESIISAWEYILSKWDMVKGFYAEQIKLSQINANLPNILMQLKTSKTNNRDAKFSNIQNEIGNVDFDQIE
jgi:hypothetical protein